MTRIDLNDPQELDLAFQFAQAVWTSRDQQIACRLTHVERSRPHGEASNYWICDLFGGRVTRLGAAVNSGGASCR